MAGGQPNPSQAASPLQSTRQMLDELDAIMDRMLALPVAEPAEPAAAPREAKPPTLAASLTLLEHDRAAPAPPPAAPSRPEAPAGAPRPHAWRAPPAPPPAELPPLPPAAAAAVEPLPLAPWMAPRPSAPAAGPDEVPAPAPAPGLWWLLPLLWCNQAFDRATHALGGPGHWLREAGGRAVLGYSGIALLLLALLLLVRDALGWTW